MISTSAPPRKARMSIRGILVTTAATLAVIGCVNYWIDPFQQYREPSFYPARYWRSLQRYITPGMAKRPDYSVAIVGSSMLETLGRKEAEQLLGGPTRNLCLSGVSAYEMGLLLDIAFEHAPVRRAIVDLNVNGFAGAVNKRWVKDPLPSHLWDNAPHNDFRYLLSLDTLIRSLDIVVRRRGGPPHSDDTDTPWTWPKDSKFSGKHVVEGLDPADLNRKYKQPPRNTAEMIANFDANILSRIRRHPAIHFDLVHPPYSILVWADFQQRKQVDVTLDFKRLVFERIKDLPNATIHDFQDTSVIEDLDKYTDIYHYSHDVSHWLFEGVRDGTFRQTAANLDSRLEAQRQQALHADPARIIARYR